MDRAVVVLLIDAATKAASPKPGRVAGHHPPRSRKQAIDAFRAILVERLASFGLTDREMQVSLLVLKGKTQEAIAKEIRLEVSTVRFHLANIYEKAGCKSKAGFFEKVYAGIL